jgi:hypothetical protein
MRNWILAIALAASVATVGGAKGATRPATLATFAGGWSGHDRGMTINRWGRGFAQVNWGAGCPCFGVAFQLSHVEGTAENATATEIVVRLYGWRPTPPPLPRIGQHAMLRLRQGVIQESFTRTDYCGPEAKGPTECGA